MKRTNVFCAALAALLLCDARAAITGQWDFNSNLSGSVGQPITYLDGDGAATQGQTQFGTTTSFGIPNVNGEVANVMKFGVNQPAMGYAVPHGMPASGGFNVNQWTIIMDVLFPASANNQWRALVQTDVSNPPNDDAEFYLNEANGLGIGGQYQGSVAADTWVRLALAADLTAEAPRIRKYINGTFVGQHTGSLDGRFALTPDAAVLLFTDGYEGGIYTQPGYINSLQIHNEALSDAFIAALGAPAAAGIPTQVQTKPFVRSVSPTPGANASPEQAFAATVENGVTRLNTNSVRLSLNGASVTPTFAVSNNVTTIRFTGSNLFPAGSTQTWQLVFSDDATPASLATNTTQIVVANYTDLKLPAPLFYENFENTAEGALPSGWTNQSFSPISFPEEDLDFLNSASFARWLVLDAARFQGTFGTYSNPDANDADYQRVLLYDPAYVVNGQIVNSLAHGKFAFANSGYRDGSGQVLYLYTPDISTTGRTNIHLVFNSIWEQNQDSIAGVEFSTDSGQTWQPVVYYLNAGDIVRANDAIDAVATFSAEHGDVARYTDDTGTERGGTYGAFIGAPITEALAPFISGRADDDPRGSKRVESFRVAGADNRATVRLRFFHAGADSWYFGIDNVGLYSIQNVEAPVIGTQPQNATVTAGDFATFTVQASGTGLSYQWLFNGTPLAGQTNATLRVDPAQAANAGLYSVRVTNSGGSVTSDEARLTVNAAPPSVVGIWHFDNNLNSANGTGTLTYASPETQTLSSFKTTDGTTVPHIGGAPATYLDLGQLPAGTNGLYLTTPVKPNGGGNYVNRYTMVWDVYIPGPLNWTPFFNSAPSPGTSNDADFYVDDTGRLGIGALGYSPANTIAPDRWYRITFAADLPRGEVTYYVDGQQVYKRTGASLAEGRFALYSDNDAGPDVLLFSEPTGGYNHPILVNSFLFIDRALTAAEVAALNGPKAGGIALAGQPRVSITRNAGNVTISWSDATGLVQVQKTTSLTNPNWQNLTTPAGATSITEPITGQAAFYRVQQLP